jgi:plasmid stabilization system protein ParE
VTRYEVRLAAAAQKDIIDALAWYRARNGLVADAFRDQVFAAIDGIATAPLAHPADGDGNRHRALRRFPYSIFYEVEGETITVLAVAHHRRRPGYWKA